MGWLILYGKGIVMEKSKAVVKYFALTYPWGDVISESRMMKLVFLADWRSALRLGRQITEADWVFGRRGPHSDDILNVIRSTLPESCINILIAEEKDLLDFVVRSTSRKSWSELTQLVYSTYPLMTKNRFEKLDLISLAKNYMSETLD